MCYYEHFTKIIIIAINLLLVGVLLACFAIAVGLYFGALGLICSIIALFIGGKSRKIKIINK